MSVYVDSMFAAYRRMKMCHMLADTTAELLAMADAIGVQRKWLQHAGTPKEHFDVCMAKRDAALKLGAISVDGRRLVQIMRAKRAACAAAGRPVNPAPEPPEGR